MPIRLWSFVSSHDATRVPVVEVVDAVIPSTMRLHRILLFLSPARRSPTARPAPMPRGPRPACSDLMYSIRLATPSSFTSPWNVGINGWYPATVLACERQDRFAKVAFVGDDRRAVVERDRRSEHADERRSAPGAVAEVARHAGQLGEQLLAALGHARTG